MSDVKRSEAQLIGRRVAVTSSDWQRTLTGTLVAVERYTLVIERQPGKRVVVYKHAVSALAPVGGEEEGEKT